MDTLWREAITCEMSQNMNGSAGKLMLSQDGFLEFSELTNLCAQDTNCLVQCFALHHMTRYVSFIILSEHIDVG